MKKKVHFYLVWASTPENASRCRELSIVVKLEHGMYVCMYVCMYACVCVGPGGVVVWVLGS